MTPSLANVNDTEYQVRVEALLVGWDTPALLEAVTQALKESGVRRRDFGIGPTVITHTEGEGDDNQAWLAFPVLAGSSAELELVAGQVHTALTNAGVVLVATPQVLSARPVEPIVARAKGVDYDEAKRRLDIAADADPLELLLRGRTRTVRGRP